MRRVRVQPAALSVQQATAQAERKRLRDFEHQVDVRLRLHRGTITHGLAWMEIDLAGRRGICEGCRRTGCRLWQGGWFEYDGEPEQQPYRVMQTGPLCAPCVSKRQIEEHAVPIWRPSSLARS